MTSDHPSIVIHWDTVSVARTKLSKVLIPALGPVHDLRQISLFDLLHCRPVNTPRLPRSQGCTISPTGTISPLQYRIEWAQAHIGKDIL